MEIPGLVEIPDVVEDITAHACVTNPELLLESKEIKSRPKAALQISLKKPEQSSILKRRAGRPLGQC